MQAGRGMNWDRPSNVEAALMFITGEEADQDCNVCLRGTGPFNGCFRSQYCGKGECATCHYNSESNRCGFLVDNKDKENSDESDDDPSVKYRPSKAGSTRKSTTRANTRVASARGGRGVNTSSDIANYASWSTTAKSQNPPPKRALNTSKAHKRTSPPAKKTRVRVELFRGRPVSAAIGKLPRRLS